MRGKEKIFTGCDALMITTVGIKKSQHFALVELTKKEPKKSYAELHREALDLFINQQNKK